MQQPLDIGKVFASPKKPENNNSFDTLVIHYQDLFMTAKLHFLAFITSILKPFLVLFHSKVSKRLIVLMYKKGKTDEARIVSKAKKEEWLKNKINQMEEFLTHIGAAAKDDLSKAKVATEKKRKF